MITLVQEIAEYARTSEGGEDFGVFPQNGEPLVSDPGYLETITGIGKEDTWFDGNTPQGTSYTEEVMGFLDTVKDTGKLVLVVDYPTRRALVDGFYEEALKKGYVPYATVRDLDKLVINPGHQPD
jgi:cysteinyl-tRNA synthetase